VTFWSLCRQLCEEIETSLGPRLARVCRVQGPTARSPKASCRDVTSALYEEVVGAVLLIRRLDGLLADDRCRRPLSRLQMAADPCAPGSSPHNW
jgi:hypothetical protein